MLLGIGVVGAGGVIAWLALDNNPISSKPASGLQNNPASGPSSLTPTSGAQAGPIDQQLAQLQAQLNQGGPAYTQAAEELIRIGTRESIRMLVLDIANREPTNETYQALHKLAEQKNRAIADWLLELLPQLPKSEEQSFQLKLLAEILGIKASPETLRSIGALAQSAPDVQTKDFLFGAIASSGSEADTIPVLMDFAVLPDWQAEGRASVSVAASFALGKQGSPAAVRFLFLQQAAEPSVEAPGTQGLEKVQSANSLPLLLSIAKGTEPTFKEVSSRQVAIGVLGNIKHEEGWHTLRELQQDPDPQISQTAKVTLKQVSNRFGIEFE